MVDNQPEWAVDIPRQIKADACLSAWDELMKNKKLAKKTGKPFRMKFKARKDVVQSCYIPKTAIKEKGIYYTISGLGLRYSEPLPEGSGDSRLVYRQGRWYLSTSYKTIIQRAENQGRIVALDPGVRTFQTFFAEVSAGELGAGDFGHFARLCHHLDRLLSRMAKAPARRRASYKKAADRLRWRIRDLRDEIHHKAARFLVDNYDIILLPTFEVSQMVSRSKRRLRKKTVRNMLTWGHFGFKQFLKHKAFEAGKVVIDVNEAYTSKTCSWSGEIVNIGGVKVIKGSDGIRMDRDYNGARGIYLRALRDTSSLYSQVERAMVS